MAFSPIPMGSRPIRIVSSDGSSIDPSSAQRALDSLNSRIERLEFNAREVSSGVSAISQSGRLLEVQTFTENGIYLPTPGTRNIHVQLCGTGGSGGGASAVGITLSCAGGGGSGVTLDFWIASGTLITGGPVSIGAIPAAGSSSGGNGAAGGDSSVMINGITYLAKGGGGGTGSTASGALSVASRGVPGLGSTSIGTHTGDAGEDGVIFSGAGGGAGWSGDGGSSALGPGGVRASTNAQPSAPVGFGGGGAGAAAANGSAAGGLPARGILIIEEYS